MSQSKQAKAVKVTRNVKKNNFLKVRSETSVVFNTYSSDGVRLRPKEVLQTLEDRRIEILQDLARKKHSAILLMELNKVQDEITLCKNFFEKRSTLAKRHRDRNKKSKVEAVLTSLMKMNPDELQVIREALLCPLCHGDIISESHRERRKGMDVLDPDSSLTSDNDEESESSGDKMSDIVVPEDEEYSDEEFHHGKFSST